MAFGFVLKASYKLKSLYMSAALGHTISSTKHE
jgi:hypothetical protein